MSDHNKVEFEALVDAHVRLYGDTGVDRIHLKSEFAAERARCWTKPDEVNNILHWLEYCAQSSEMDVEEISLKDMNNWGTDETGARIKHISGDFYEITNFGIAITNFIPFLVAQEF